jgi:uncharacterized repeat protein (TIGR02543 family)
MKTKFLQRVLWLMMPLLTIFTTNVWATAPTIAELNLGTPLISDNFNSLSPIETKDGVPDPSGHSDTKTNQTAYGVFTDCYVGKNNNIGYGIYESAAPFSSQYLKVFGNGSQLATMYLYNTNIKNKGSFDIYINAGSAGVFGIYSDVDNTNEFSKGKTVVFFKISGNELTISDGNSTHTWQSVKTSLSGLTRVTAVYNVSGSAQTYNGISIANGNAHVYVNGTAVMDGDNPKAFTIPTGRNPYYFRINSKYSAGLSIDDLNIYDALPTAGSMHVTYNANGATSGSVPTDATDYSSGNTVTVKANTGSLARTGCTFAGWNTAADGSGTNYAASGSATFNISANTTLYAKWTATVTWEVNGTTVRTDPDLVIPAAGKSVTPPSAPDPLPCGNKFMGWTTDNIGSTGLDKDVPADATRIAGLNLFTSSTTVTGATTFYAVFADYAE